MPNPASLQARLFGDRWLALDLPRHLVHVPAPTLIDRLRTLGHALQRDADVVVMLHPDGQYEPSLIPELIDPILAGEADLVLGSRMALPGAARAGGMPLYKVAANRFLTGIENRVMRTALTDLHTGYRAYSREFLLRVPFLRNALDFSFDSEILMQASHFGFRIGEVPARTRFADASSITVGPATV